MAEYKGGKHLWYVIGYLQKEIDIPLFQATYEEDYVRVQPISELTEQDKQERIFPKIEIAVRVEKEEAKNKCQN